MINLNPKRNGYFQKTQHVFTPTYNSYLNTTYTITSLEEYRFWLSWVSMSIIAYKDEVFAKQEVTNDIEIKVLEDTWNQLIADPFIGNLILSFKEFESQVIMDSLIENSYYKDEIQLSKLNQQRLYYLNRFKTTLNVNLKFR